MKQKVLLDDNRYRKPTRIPTTVPTRVAAAAPATPIPIGPIKR